MASDTIYVYEHIVALIKNRLVGQTLTSEQLSTLLDAIGLEMKLVDVITEGAFDLLLSDGMTIKREKSDLRVDIQYTPHNTDSKHGLCDVKLTFYAITAAVRELMCTMPEWRMWNKMTEEVHTALATMPSEDERDDLVYTVLFEAVPYGRYFFKNDLQAHKVLDMMLAEAS